MSDQQTGSTSAPELACPNCRAKVLWSEEFPHRPFCSKRCQLSDFGEWANEKHRVASANEDDDTLSDEPFSEY